MNTDQANATAVERMISAKPILKAVATARDVIPGMKDNLILHAGPPLTWARMSGPVRGAMIGAMLFEGLAADETEAASMAERGEVEFDSCHHHGAVGPMAGATSASMKVYVVENVEHGNKAYSNLNEGYGKVLRYGAYSDDVLKKLRWMNDVLGVALADALAQTDGIDMRALIAEALQMGDEGHNRNKAGSLIYLKTIAPLIVKVVKDDSVASDVLKFIGDNMLSVLNPVMASCKAMTDAAHGVEGSTIVSTMARNGTDFGIRVSGLGEKQWFTAPAQIPIGKFFPGFTQDDANPDVGDSAITETAGIGGFAMAAAPAIVTFVGGTPEDTMKATLEMYSITTAENQNFSIPALNFRGTPTGIDIRKVVETKIAPRINTGIAHKNAGVGQVGAGLVRPPMKIFEDALVAHTEKYGL